MKASAKKLWWESNFLKVKRQKLHLGEKEATKIAEEYGTPLFVYSKNQILTNYRDLLEAFSSTTSLEVRICYAMKANPNQNILKILKEEGAWIDAVSPGEVNTALRAGFPKKKIIFTGTSVSTNDLEHVLNLRNIIVNVDAEEQLDLMKEIVKRRTNNKNIRVSLRWNPGIGRGFNARVITAGAKSQDGTPVKFGIEEKKIIHALQKAVHYGFIPVGLHQHLGSGWTKQDFDAVKQAVDKIIQKCSEIEKSGIFLEFIDFGGGFGPKYHENQDIFPLKHYVEYISRKIKKSGLRIKSVAVEPGKYLVGDAGVLLVKVEYIKKSYKNTFACVNAGTFNTVPRPAIYTEAHHHIVNCSKVFSDKDEKITIAGNLCETGDVFGKEVIMPLPKRDTTLAVLHAGAYCRSMASTYNLREIPEEIII
ncbi:MAG: diaminopimelate decarboxylase [Candidatus Aminicenantaceae bacterium]